MNVANLSVSFATTPEEKLPVSCFVQGLYAPRYKTAPPIADVYAYVSERGIIVASMGLEFACPDGLFQVERTYRIKREFVGVPISDQNTVQLGRWASINQTAGMLAAWAAVTYAIEHKKVHGLAEHDRMVHRHCERTLGVIFREIPHGPPDLDTMPEEHRACHRDGLMRPYVVDLGQIQESLITRIKAG